jgi:hypothetical protein
LVDDAAHWLFRAEEMLALAEQMKHEETKAIMIRLASEEVFALAAMLASKSFPTGGRSEGTMMIALPPARFW